MNRYNIGPLTMEYVFKRAGIENVSDMQAVFDAVEVALKPSEIAADFIDKHHVSCAEATANDGVYEEAPLLVDELANCVGYFEWKDHE